MLSWFTGAVARIVYICAQYNEDVDIVSDTMFRLEVILIPVNEINKIIDIQRYIA
jgi:hypothetical protein